MSKKSKQRAKHHKHSLPAQTQPRNFASWLSTISNYMVEGDYTAAVSLCERLLALLPQRTSQRAEVLAQLGTAQAMLQNFPQSYEALTEALSIDPNSADIWYNRGLASRFTTRIGQSL